ncbi:hypothetical protein FD755_016659 [Muntiacus reevesi]|uniref:COG complex component COG2 C-terminal domain-containing protein n=1 Tax=Muntiacus reevesi TaxID=9886 RepID=A0A5N3XDA9_MUNRE|nr:hypothetical protein FD755_016659 [Muntiacus reevesi]
MCFISDSIKIFKCIKLVSQHPCKEDIQILVIREQCVALSFCHIYFFCFHFLTVPLHALLLIFSRIIVWEMRKQKHCIIKKQHSPLLTEILERIATEFNQLQCHAVQSKALPVLDKIRPGTRIAGITAMLQQSLEGLLLEGLQTSSVDIIRPCLRTYATIDKTWDAEALVGQVLVKPYIDEVILEQIVDSYLSDLQFTYDKLLEFVPHHCHLLREVTGGAISSEKGSTVSGYDFLVNSLWPEIVRGLEEKLPLLFNPGNPDGFHQKYTISMDFVRTFERQCGSKASVKRLRAHSAYHSFSNKWNLPIYFQIRFREIAGSLEVALTDVLEDAPALPLRLLNCAFLPLAGSLYCLLASHRTWSSLQRCRSDKMFLPLLAHRLWRLMLQILAQYSKFVKELLLRPNSNESAKDIKKPLVTGSKDLSITQGNCEDQASGPSETKPIVSISSTQLICVVTDLDRLQEQHPFPSLWRCLCPRLACSAAEGSGRPAADFSLVEPQSLMGWILIVSSLLTQYLSFKSAELLKRILPLEWEVTDKPKERLQDPWRHHHKLPLTEYKMLKGRLDYKETQPLHPKGYQAWDPGGRPGCSPHRIQARRRQASAWELSPAEQT